MIRLTGLVNLKAVGSKPIGSTVTEELTDKQTKLDVDGDGKLEKSDFEKLRVEMKLKKLKEMQMSPEQEKKKGDISTDKSALGKK